jgi:DNA replication protein DnaC
VLVGGTGKTHLAIAIARSCIRSSARGRFYNMVDLVSRLEIEGQRRNVFAFCPLAFGSGPREQDEGP